eukprot:scaffold66924_cov18-Tisochrysis_lutea.AAC.2
MPSKWSFSQGALDVLSPFDLLLTRLMCLAHAAWAKGTCNSGAPYESTCAETPREALCTCQILQAFMYARDPSTLAARKAAIHRAALHKAAVQGQAVRNILVYASHSKLCCCCGFLVFAQIRSLLASGAMTSVMQLLGRPYRFVLLLDDASRILSPSNVSNSQQQQQQQHWSPLPVVSFSYPPNLQPQSAPPAQPHPSSSPTSPTTTNCSSDGSVSNTSTSGSSVGSSAGGGTAGVAEASSSGAVERTATDMQDRRRGHLGSSSNPAPGQHAAPCDSRGQAGVQSAEGAGGLQGEGSEDVDTTTRTHPSVPMQVLNQPPGQGLFSCQVALVPCHQQGGAEEFGDREPDGWPGPQTGPGDLPPALASLEEERGQGRWCVWVRGSEREPRSRVLYEHPFFRPSSISGSSTSSFRHLYMASAQHCQVGTELLWSPPYDPLPLWAVVLGGLPEPAAY